MLRQIFLFTSNLPLGVRNMILGGFIGYSEAQTMRAGTQIHQLFSRILTHWKGDASMINSALKLSVGRSPDCEMPMKQVSLNRCGCVERIRVSLDLLDILNDERRQNEEDIRSKEATLRSIRRDIGGTVEGGNIFPGILHDIVFDVKIHG